MKYLKGGGLLPQKDNLFQIIKSFIGGALSIFILAYLTEMSGSAWLMAPFGASCVILYAASQSPFAQPRNVIGGHLLSGFIGLLMLSFLGNNILSVSIAVGLSIALMQYLRLTHPPAGANPLVIILTGNQHAVNWDFLLNPILSGSVTLVVIAFIINNLGINNHWPIYWHGMNRNKQKRT